MEKTTKQSLRERVITGAERVMKSNGAVGFLDVLGQLRFLESAHFEGWKKGLPYYSILSDHIQCGPKKLQQAEEHFLQWVRDNDLEPFDVLFQKSGRNGPTPLKLTQDGDPDREAFLSTKFRSRDITPAQKERLEQKANKAPDLLVYWQTGDESKCSECQQELYKGSLIFLENKQALCMDCADMADLCFLPSGNATLTRRAKKHSKLSAIVLKFNRGRKRYERQGILVTEEAIAQAEASCDADADKRAFQREKATARRAQVDEQLVKDMTEMIMADYPGCPPDEATKIAMHTAQRGSGRVGRSAAGRARDQKAIQLAVQAWVRHQHTEYDALLMGGVEREDARDQIRADSNETLGRWQAG